MKIYTLQRIENIANCVFFPTKIFHKAASFVRNYFFVGPIPKIANMSDDDRDIDIESDVSVAKHWQLHIISERHRETQKVLMIYWAPIELTNKIAVLFRFPGWHWWRWQNARTSKQFDPIFFAGKPLSVSGTLRGCHCFRKLVNERVSRPFDKCGHRTNVNAFRRCRISQLTNADLHLCTLFGCLHSTVKFCLFVHFQAEKRAHHNALERKRRDHIKDSFTSLRDSVPSLQGEKVVSAWWVGIVDGKKFTRYVLNFSCFSTYFRYDLKRRVEPKYWRRPPST